MGVGEPAVLEIHGVNPLELPKLYVTVSVTDALGRSIPDLAASEFAIAGQIAELGRLVDVEHITNDNLDFAVVLALDTSSSMFGFPLNALKEAANSFIDLIGDNAMVALIDFDSDSQHILDFTTDQRTLRAAIADLLAGGTTALYQASLEAVELAANAPTPRRAVIILSDGHEYGGVSSAEREDARTAAAHRGVPVYTIGLGYDQFDRDYLQNLSAAGYGTFSESPTPEQLKALYQGFASLFRGQYVLTIEADLPLDGHRYSLAVELETAAGRIASALGDVRAPIPVPYITPLVELPLTPIREPTRFSFAVAADDALAEVILELDGVPVETIMEAGAYGTTVVPVQMAPGPHELTITARDVDGDVAQVSQPFAVAALPPEITVTSSLLEEPVLTEPTEVSVTVGGQTRFATAKIMIDGVAEASLEEEIRLTLDPYDFDAGLHDVEFIVTNEADQAASQQLTFEVPPLPPVFEFEGLESGDLLEEATQLDLALIEAQPGSALLSRYRLNDGPDIPIEGEIELDPRDLPPGEHTITVAVEDQTTGETSEETVDFSVPPLKPESVVAGLEAGDELREDRRIEVGVESQTEVLRVVARLNGEEIERILEAPYEVDLDVLDLPPGDHTLEIQVVNEGLREEVTTIEFSVAEEPAQTATAVVVTATQRAVVTATARGAMTATQRAQVTATQEARATATEIVRAAATQGARATATIQSLRERARENVRLTATQRTHATATEIVRAAATQRAQVTATQ
ncbi:MAG: VWA domain-containing protein, partial [Anaerolineaceae bacterium]|nr:VWA domain-containing protein [Anaerolineaceae bacterium]